MQFAIRLSRVVTVKPHYEASLRRLPTKVLVYNCYRVRLQQRTPPVLAKRDKVDDEPFLLDKVGTTYLLKNCEIDVIHACTSHMQ